MTSESNVEIFERLLEDFNADGVEAAIPYFAEDIEVYDPDLPEGPYRGQLALRYVLDQLLGGAERTEVRGWEFVPAGDRVVGLLRTYSRGEGGNPEVELRDAHTMTFRDGKIIYWRLYLDPGEALSDVGLDPELRTDGDGSGSWSEPPE